MAATQKYGIKYPFESYNTEEVYLDTNDTLKDDVKSRVLHVLFTPKGQRIRGPEFGTNLTKYIFDPNDGATYDNIIKEISTDLKKFVPEVNLEKISITDSEKGDNGKIVVIHYSVRNGNVIENTSVGVQL